MTPTQLDEFTKLIHIAQVEKELDRLSDEETTPDFLAIRKCIVKIFPEYEDYPNEETLHSS